MIIIVDLKKIRSDIQFGWRNALKCSCTGRNGEVLESDAHKDMKYMVAKYCWNNRLTFYSEVSFKGGGRCDLLIEDLGICCEIIHSETLRYFLTKKYPLPVLPVESMMSEKDLKAMLDDIVTTGGTGVDYYYRKFLEKKKVKL